MSKLPYSHGTSGQNALSEIQKILRGFGCNKFGSMIDDDAHEVLVQFEWNQRKCQVKASMSGYAAAYLRANPWTDRKKSSKIEWERQAMDIASVAVYSILRDWIKGQVTAIETGIVSFDGASRLWTTLVGLALFPV